MSSSSADIFEKLLPRAIGSRSLSFLSGEGNDSSSSTTSMDLLISPPRLSNVLREKTIGNNSLQLFDETKSYYELFPAIENKRKKNAEDDLVKFGLTWDSFIKPKISFSQPSRKVNANFDKRIEEQNGRNLLDHFLTAIEENLRLDQVSSNKYGVASGLSKGQLACLIAKQLYIAKRKFKNNLSVKSVFKDLQNMGIGLTLDPKIQKLVQTVKEENVIKVIQYLEKVVDWIDRFAKPGLHEEEERRYSKIEKVLIGTGESKNTNTHFVTSESENDDNGIDIDENVEFGSMDDAEHSAHLYHQFRPLVVFSKSQLENVLDQTNLFSHISQEDEDIYDENEEEEEEPTSMFSMEWLEKECKKVCKTAGIENAVMELLQKKGQSDVELQSRLFDILGENAFELMSIIMEHKSELLKDFYKRQMEENAVEGINSFSHIKMTTSKFKEAKKGLRKAGKKLGRKHQKKINLSGGGVNLNEQLELKELYQKFKKEKDRTVLKEGEGEARVLKLGRDVIPEDKNEADKETQERVIRQQTYEEHVFPAPKPRQDTQPLVPISVFEDWAQLAFKGYTHLNRVQSDVFYSAYKTSENLLICAPTGCGKTNVAMLTVLREIGQHFRGGKIRREEFKIIYIAPMKALAAEMVENFSKRLAPLGIVVKEMTGDMQLTKQEVQQTQMIVTTPEKWDVTTRKATDQALIQLTRLIIIDEVHLLNEDRGPVIESIVARTLRQMETTQSLIRLVGLSATLPNYMDVAHFLRVNPHSGLHFFDGSYRPVPLEQSFIGVSLRNPIQRSQEYNNIAYNRALKNLKKQKQVMVFVHSRKETSTTAKALLDLAMQEGTLEFFTQGVPENEHTKKWVTKALEKCHNRELKDLVPKGLGIHHAGLVRSDRNLVEKLFAEGVIRVLCCTSTLAWGVNLPSYCCIIKGTEVYNAEKGQMTELGMLDIMQIFGRAGRPQFDVEGEGVIITSYDQLPRYLNLLKRNLPIESQMTQDLANHLCAEIVLGTVSNVREGSLWLNYTYLFLRMRQNPMNYGLTFEEVQLDPTLTGTRRTLIEKACKVLQDSKMIIYDEKTGVVSATDLGRIASHYYIHYETIQLYNEKLHANLSESDVLQIVASAREFKNIKVREDESEELQELCTNSPVQVKGLNDYTGKVNVMIQSYISHVKIKNSSLISDCAFIVQSVGRIVRALFEIAVKERWSSLMDKLLTLTKCIDRRQWVFEHPLRQIPKLPSYTIQKLESKKLTLSRLVEYEESELDQVINVKGMGRVVMEAIDKFPNLDLEANVQPITRSVLRFQVKIRPNFTWDKKLHGETEPWWIWVEDENSEYIYHSEYFLLKQSEHEKMMKESKGEEDDPCFTLNFVVPFKEDPRPLYFIIRAVSDKWISAEAQLTINIKDIILPEGFAPSTPLLPLDPLPVTALNNPNYEKLFTDKGIKYFNPVQTQIFHMAYHSDENILVGAPTGSGKTSIAELCMMRLFTLKPQSKVIYIAPLKALVRERLTEWEKKFVQKLGKRMVELTGDFTPDVKLLKQADIVITTPEKWDGISRNWQNRSYVRDVGLIVMDEIHLLGSERGAILEVITSRMRYISWNTQTPIRMMGLSTNMANATDLADWLGVTQRGLFNFRSSVRPVPLQISISGFSGKNYCPRMNSMNKPAYQAILRHSNNKPCLIFVSSRRQTRLTAMDLIAYCTVDENPQRFLNMNNDELIQVCELARDTNLKQFLTYGIGIHHAGLTPSDKKLVEELFLNGKIQVLIATATLAWGVNLPAYFVIIKGTEYFDPKTKRYEDYPLVDVLQMAGRSGRPGFDEEGRVFIMVHDVKKNFYKRFLYEPFPIESSLHTQLHDHINAEIVSGTIKTKQDCLDYLTWTFMFRRLVQNPFYYGIEDLSYEGLNKWLSNKISEIIDDLEFAGLVKATDLSMDKKKLLQVMATESGNTFGTMTAEKEKSEKEKQKRKGIYLEPTATGIIASYYYLSYRTASHFNRLIRPDSNINYLLELLCEAKEFAEIPVRHNEDKLNKELSEVVPLGSYLYDYESPHVKCYLLLQAHFERVKLPIVDYITDTRTVLDSTIRIAQAYIDICAEKGYLQASLNMMHILQMIMQARWEKDSTLFQLFSNLPCPRENTNTNDEIYQLVELLGIKENITELKQLLSIRYSSKNGENSLQQLLSKYTKKNSLVSNIMKIIDEFPYLTVRVDQVLHDEEEHKIEVNIIIERISKSKEQAYTPMYTKQKDEGFWLIVSNPTNQELLAMKRVRANKKINPTEIYLPITENDKELEIRVVPDCYLGLDTSAKFLCKIQTQ
ncbi:hypothetical protein C9374_010602 [Naegleria lovaniensis]|uniref:Activating signal cointegrator 1 complex subunit 3 n=1 Tax=Naegleria lovaniensis TaxID=51637 RepID=A0AA88KE02_NAELO|nr:uncharacterized protein C9374_010602 [Naegleria lovaniensis]KAG2374583.1 hypothetical protein C9374_010602 [Naegleria lovaniensis]